MSDDFRKFFAEWAPAIAGLLNLSESAKLLVAPLEAQQTALSLFRDTSRKLPKRYTYTTLLDPRRSPVRFAFRDEAEAELLDWCHEPPDGAPGWRLITGDTGRGKTRLLLHIVDKLNGMVDRPWRAGFVDPAAFRANPAALLCLRELREDLLLVIDYAERLEPEVRAFMKATLAIAGDREDRRVRLVLVSRRPSELWQKRIGVADAEIGEFIDAGGLGMDELPPLALDPAIRANVFQDAYTEYEAHYEETREISAVPDLSADDYVEVLLIHMAALALYRRELNAEELSRERLLKWVLDRERRAWNEMIDGKELPAALRDAPIEQAATLLTLITLNDGVASRDSAVQKLELCPALAGVDATVRDKVADVFHELYPGPGWAGGISLDLIGTYLLHVADDGFAARVLDNLDVGEVANALTKLNWVAQKWPDSGERKLQAVLNATEGQGLSAVVDVAIASGDPIGQIAADWLAAHSDQDLARQLEPQIPYPTTALRELAETVAAILADSVMGDDEAARAERAGRLNDQSVRLSELGRREDALAAVEEAVALYRELAAARPDAFRPYLATSLNNLSNCLSDLGRREAALAAVEEAAALYRELAAARPDAFRPDFATSLNNLGNRLSALGRREAALAAVEEAVALYRSLAAARPDAFRPDLAMSLNNLSNRLSDLGRREAALAAVEEAAALYRELAAARPDAFRPNLASSLNNLSGCLSELGRREDALAAVEESVALYRELAAARPDAFRPDLAMSLNNLSNRLSDLGRREAAVAAVEEAVAIRRDLAAARPDAFRPGLASSLNNLSAHLSALGRREDALAAVEEAVALYRALAAARPDAFRPDLAMSLNNQSGCLSALGRLEAALAAIEEAVALYRALAAARPDAFRPDLAMSLNNLSNRLSDLGRHEDALAAIEEAVAIRRELASARPDAFRPDLAASLNNLSSCLGELGRREEALAAVEEAVALYRALAAARPDAFRPDLATSLGARGMVLFAADDHDGAAASFREGLATLSDLFSAMPHAHAELILKLLQAYMSASQAASLEPDAELLEPIIAKLVEIGAVEVRQETDVAE